MKRIFIASGIVAPLISFGFIAISIYMSPWFSWQSNALSDLGHSVKSSVAPLFNFGLLLGGFLIMIYAVTVMREYARYTSLCLTFSALTLQLVAVYNENYGFLHFIVSVLFFLSIGVASISYTVECHSNWALLAVIIGLSSWILFSLNIWEIGIAVPEVVSAGSVVSWLVYSAVKIY